jgi:hypothetical protein
MELENDISELPRATTRNGVLPQDPSILSGDSFNLPPLVYRALRQVSASEELIKFTSTPPLQLVNAGTVIRSKRYCRQVWFYGLKALANVPANHTPNANNAYWGWSAQTCVNQVVPWTGIYGSLIQPADGQIIDLWQL